MPSLTWAKGGHADILAITGDTLELRSSTPAPPGARLEASLTEEPHAFVKIKSYGSRRNEDGSFSLKGRLLDASRDLRDRLATLVVPHPPSTRVG
jgi:hypothetical protein